MPSDKAAGGLSAPLSRRAALGGLSLLPLAAMIRGIPTGSADTTHTGYRFLSPHQAAVLDAATRRLIPGSHEAAVVTYLDRLLSVFDVSPPDVHAGGPYSNRAGGSEDLMATFVPLTRAQTYAWRQRVAQLRDEYTNGIALLDQQAGGDFTSVPWVRQDIVLAQAPFTSVLFGHTAEAMYAVPEYGGNAHLVGWRDIYHPGDSQPRGYTNAEVEAAEFDPIGFPPNGIVARLLNGGWEEVVAAMGGIGGLGLLSVAAVKAGRLWPAARDAVRSPASGPKDDPLEAAAPETDPNTEPASAATGDDGGVNAGH